MIADVFTKIVAGAQDKRLSVRFYNDCDVLLHGVDFKWYGQLLGYGSKHPFWYIWDLEHVSMGSDGKSRNMDVVCLLYI
jgi:hypothetical protein